MVPFDDFSATLADFTPAVYQIFGHQSMDIQPVSTVRIYVITMNSMIRTKYHIKEWLLW